MKIISRRKHRIVARRSEAYALRVNQSMHYAIKIYAGIEKTTIVDATDRLLRIGLVYESLKKNLRVCEKKEKYNKHRGDCLVVAGDVAPATSSHHLKT